MARTIRPKPAAKTGPTTPDPIEIAMEAEAGDASPDSPARRVLIKQEKLIGWQIAGERAGFLLKVMMAVLGLVVALMAAWAIWDASRYQGLVVEAFSAPPDLAARGLTGEVLAGKLLDDLVRMQTGTNSIRAAGSYAIDWGDKIEVQIPQTGVSIGDLQRVLRETLGRETRISGVVYRQPDGQLSVIARTGGAAGKTFTGPEGELDSLVLRAAESVYGQTQPYRYSAYLMAGGRPEEAEQVLSNFQFREDAEAAWALRGWAYMDMEKQRYAEARAKLLRALAIEPDMAPLYFTLGQVEMALGHSEAALTALRRGQRLFRSGRAKEVSPQGVKVMAASLDIMELGLVPDFRGLATAKREAGFGFTSRSNLQEQAAAWGAAHDPDRVRAILAQLPAPRGDERTLKLDEAQRQFTLGLSAMGNGDPATAAGHFDAARALLEAGGRGHTAMASVRPALGEALAMTGRTDEARAAVAPLPDDCDSCLIAKAAVESLAGRHLEADRMFARVVARAPSNPFAYQAWAEARLRSGDAAGAVRLFRKARKAAPKWPDPLKGEGDAQMALGRPLAAIRLYERAAKEAPRWGGLHVAWTEALAASGDTEAAAAMRRKAAGMSLSVLDRARLSGR